MVVGEGFEPSKSMTADLQSAPFGRSGTPPRGNAFYWPASCWKRGASYQMRRPCKAFLSVNEVVCLLFIRKGAKLINSFSEGLKNDRSVTVNEDALGQHLIQRTA